MVNTTLSATVAAYMLYVSKGETPHDAIELATIDTKNVERDYEAKLAASKREVFSFLNPDVSQEVKSAATYLVYGMLNFDALPAGAIDGITSYLDALDEYFKLSTIPEESRCSNNNPLKGIWELNQFTV